VYQGSDVFLEYVPLYHFSPAKAAFGCVSGGKLSPVTRLGWLNFSTSYLCLFTNQRDH